jgi:hypothetical protein
MSDDQVKQATSEVFDVLLERSGLRVAPQTEASEAIEIST